MTEVEFLRDVISRARKEMWRYCYEYRDDAEEPLDDDIVTRILNEGLNYDGR